MLRRSMWSLVPGYAKPFQRLKDIFYISGPRARCIYIVYPQAQRATRAVYQGIGEHKVQRIAYVQVA